VSVLFAFIIAFGVSFTTIHTVFADLLDFVDISWHPGWFFGLLAALIFLPFIGLLYGGIKVLFRIKTKVRVGLIILLLWIAALFTCIGLSVSHAKNLMHWRTAHEYIELPFAQYDTLYVDIPQHYYQEGTLESVINADDHWQFNFNKKHFVKHGKSSRKWKKHGKKNWEDYSAEFSGDNLLMFYSQKNENADVQLLLMPFIEDWHWAEDDHFSIDVSKDAAGRKRQSAYRHAQQVPFNYTLQDSLLIVEPLLYTKNSKWNGEFLRLRFNIPEGKSVVYGKAFGQ
jgi:hypothetical protein